MGRATTTRGHTEIFRPPIPIRTSLRHCCLFRRAESGHPRQPPSIHGRPARRITAGAGAEVDPPWPTWGCGCWAAKNPGFAVAGFNAHCLGKTAWFGSQDCGGHRPAVHQPRRRHPWPRARSRLTSDNSCKALGGCYDIVWPKIPRIRATYPHSAPGFGSRPRYQHLFASMTASTAPSGAHFIRHVGGFTGRLRKPARAAPTRRACGMPSTPATSDVGQSWRAASDTGGWRTGARL